MIQRKLVQQALLQQAMNLKNSACEITAFAQPLLLNDDERDALRNASQLAERLVERVKGAENAALDSSDSEEHWFVQNPIEDDGIGTNSLL